MILSFHFRVATIVSDVIHQHGKDSKSMIIMISINKALREYYLHVVYENMVIVNYIISDFCRISHNILFMMNCPFTKGPSRCWPKFVHKCPKK